MSYDFRLFKRRAGENELVTAKADSEGLPTTPADPQKEALKRRVADALIAGNPQLAVFQFDYAAVAKSQNISEDQARIKFRHLELNGPADGLRLEHLGEFRYTRQVIEESLRVYPTIWSIGRFCVEDDELGGYRIPARTNVVIPIFYFHWNPRFWVEPERFDPDRFAPERRPAPDSMIYFPFGAGPRSCVGNHFAFQELMIMTVLLFRHFRFRVAPGASVEPDPLITLRPKYGLRMLLSERRPASTPEIVT